MTTKTAWVIASKPFIDTGTFSIVVNQTEVCAIPSGNYYLYDAQNGLSLLYALEQQCLTHPEVTSATAELLESGKVRLTLETVGSTPWTLHWGAGVIRWTPDVMLGFSGDLTPAAMSFTADLYSPMFWSPGKTESPQLAPAGVMGTLADNDQPAHWTAHRWHRTCRPEAEYRRNIFVWRNVATARFATADKLAGELQSIYTHHLKKLYNFKLYRNVEEDRSGSAPVSLGSPLGPYILVPNEGQRTAAFPFARSPGFEWVDAWHPVSLECMSAKEYSP